MGAPYLVFWQSGKHVRISENSKNGALIERQDAGAPGLQFSEMPS